MGTYQYLYCNMYDYIIDLVMIIGYEPADLTVHPPPSTAEGGFIFFV